jgi:hypothetical protein
MSGTNDLATHLGGVPVGGVPYSWLKGPKGRVLFVAPFRTAAAASNGSTNASDDNPGTLAYPLKTIARAYAMCTGGLGEIIYVLGYSNTAANITDDWSAGVTWSKNAVHLIGLAPQHYFSHRARIGQLSTATAVSPLLNVTGNNCVFANFEIFQGVADATSLVNVQVTGQRNVFDNVHIAGIGDATMVAAGAASLKIDGGAENYFKNCTIGLDTITRDQNCRELWLDTAATRNVFEDCLFDAFVSNAGYCFVKVNDSTGIDRALIFKNCLFTAKSANKAITLTSVFDIPAISQGAIILQNSKVFSDGGATDWDSNNRGIIWNDSVAAAASAGGGILTNQ